MLGPTVQLQAAPHRCIERTLRAARVGSEEDRKRAGITLASLAQARVPHAEQAVVDLHRDRVRREARRLRVAEVDIGHYVSIGLVTLLDRLRRFDPARGVPLWGYARARVRGEMIGELGASLGLTPYQTSAYRRVWAASDMAAMDLAPPGRTPTASDVVERARSAFGVGFGVETSRRSSVPRGVGMFGLRS